jgi:mono/diheme cytochrome c family protein
MLFSLVFFVVFVRAAEPAAVAASPQAENVQESQNVQELIRALKISFPQDGSSVLFLEQGGKKYRIDVATRSISQVNGSQVSGAQADSPRTNATRPAALLAAQSTSQPAGETLFHANCAPCHGPDGKGIWSVGTPDFTSIGGDQAHVAQTIRKGRDGKMPSFSGRLSDPEITAISQWVSGLGTAATPTQKSEPGVYKPGDDVLFSLPTGRPLDAGGVYVNFSHRFAFEPAFQGTNRGGVLFGLDDFSLSSLGLRYGVTDKLSVSLYRSPSFIGRPIQFMAAYSLLEENHGAPFNLTARVSVEGQNNFRKNYTENLEAIFSRSLTHRAQVYVVPTISFNDRRLLQGSLNSNQILDEPGINAFSIGVGGAVDIRPTVAIVAEIIPTLIGFDQLGIHRPAFSFGIQKKIYRHAFTVGFTNSPGTTVSQRAGTEATFLGNQNADKPRQMFIGFDLTRQVH